MNIIKQAARKSDSSYTVYLREVDPDYDQPAGYEVVVTKDAMPPHSCEFFKTRKDALKAFNKLTKKS